MNIQIFGKPKCFDTKKAERYFKERGIKVQSIDLIEKSMSKGEIRSVIQGLGSIENLIDHESKFVCDIKYLLDNAKEEKLLENPKLFKTPIVRNGKKVTVGYQPDIWKSWENLS